MPISGRRKISSGKITVDALRYYVPIFQAGDNAAERLMEYGSEMSPHERNHYETVMKLRELAVQRIASLSAPLIAKEINKIIATSHLRGQDDLFDVLYFAGLDGMRRGLRKFEVDKINSSSTNYLFQWITTYAKKELVILEAPFGIPPSRFQRYKKISAVRKKLSEQLERYATNEEVLEYFVSGKADLQTMNGKLANKNKPSMANRSIDITIIEEQERFEKEMLTVNLLDPLEDYSGDVAMIAEQETPFNETAFGVFCSSYNVTIEARVVMMSDLGSRHFTDKEEEILSNINESRYKTLGNQWRNLIKDVNGPFYDFLKEHQNEEFVQFDIRQTINSIESSDKKINSALYGVLFEGGKALKK